MFAARNITAELLTGKEITTVGRSRLAGDIAGLECVDAPAKFAERDFLNLANAFAGHFEFLAHDFQRARLAPVEAVTQSDDFRFARREVFDVLADFLSHHLGAE